MPTKDYIFLMKGEKITNAGIHRETEMPVLFGKVPPVKHMLFMTSYLFGAVVPLDRGGKTHNIEIVLPSRTSGFNLLIRLITHEQLHSAVNDVEGWVTSAKLDRTALIKNENIHLEDEVRYYIL